MIRVENLVKRFGGLMAVDDCTLDVPAGSITAVIGPNGAGKTTLFSIIAGFLKPNSGRVLMDEHDITGLSPPALFHRGLVRTFQIPHELPRMTALENLMLVPGDQSGEQVWAAWLRPGRVRREERAVRERAEEVLQFLNLYELRHELAGRLSGGQKKLLELGRTMMTEPRVVLLDEPAAGVNRTLLGKLTETIHRLNEDRGYTFVVIEHDMDMIAELCSPVIVMAQGRVLAKGSMEEIRSNRAVLEAYLGVTEA
ncbi:ABC transporter ATP-binding protein [Algihabitans albus]|uniref:ABC transporter ATP-binding protein n=1 Tax=Algihabitans albus TaxID=2164067 RepID=UPI001ABCE568|nr:ABC transporter ATP-binding protein [Algihabitans albus]